MEQWLGRVTAMFQGWKISRKSIKNDPALAAFCSRVPELSYFTRFQKSAQHEQTKEDILLWLYAWGQETTTLHTQQSQGRQSSRLSGTVTPQSSTWQPGCIGDIVLSRRLILSFSSFDPWKISVILWPMNSFTERNSQWNWHRNWNWGHRISKSCKLKKSASAPPSFTLFVFLRFLAYIESW